MNSPELDKKINRINLWMHLAWIGHFLSLGIYYLVILQMGKSSNMQSDHDSVMLISYVLNGMGFIMAIIGVFSCKYVFKPQSLIDKLSFLNNMNNRKSFLSSHNQLDDKDSDIFTKAQKRLSLYMMALGFVQTCAVFGMMTTILANGNIIYYYPGLIFATLCGMACKPKLTKFIEQQEITT